MIEKKEIGSTVNVITYEGLQEFHCIGRVYWVAIYQ